MVELSRRKVLDTLNSRYLYGKVVRISLTFLEDSSAAINPLFYVTERLIFGMIYLAALTWNYIHNTTDHHVKTDSEIQHILCRQAK